MEWKVSKSENGYVPFGVPTFPSGKHREIGPHLLIFGPEAVQAVEPVSCPIGSVRNHKTSDIPIVKPRGYPSMGLVD